MEFSKLREELQGFINDLLAPDASTSKADIQKFCQDLDDYLAFGLFKLGILSAPPELLKFSDDYKNGKMPNKEDLSIVLSVVSSRWDLEDQILKNQAPPAPIRARLQ